MSTALRTQLIHYIDAGYPILYVNTFEEDKVDALIGTLSEGKEVYEWNETNGYVDFSTKTPLDERCTLEAMLEYLRTPELLDRKIILIKDASAYLDEPKIAAKFKGLARLITLGEADAVIIIVASSLVIPHELEKYVTILEADYPDTATIRAVIKSFAEENGLPGVTASLLDEFSVAFKGLTEFEIRNLLALAYSDDGELTRRDLRLIFEQKQQMIKKAGIMEMIPLKETIDDIGGLDALKDWFRRKAKVFRSVERAAEFGVDMPKGVLIAGMPGCGKSLSAKAAASLFEVPLLRLDMGRLMGKYVGESEGNMRRAIALAEAISPCVLWIDELEKAFAGITTGAHEVTSRLFANFLTWMQEKTSATFVVATANDITKLPPELMRKGRFDEIFYVTLPNEAERTKIFEIHIGRRRPDDLKKIDIKELVKRTDGYSGADIEGVVRDAVEAAYSDDKQCVETADLTRAISETKSLSVVMKDTIDKLSEEYKKRNFKRATK